MKKRKAGRPKGSKNKKKVVKVANVIPVQSPEILALINLVQIITRAVRNA